MSDKTLNLYPIDYPFETLVSRLRSKPPKLILNPDFQRQYKWDKTGWERASKFIESCLMRIPLPSCYFAEDKESRHVVIDGVQRITTIQKFMEDEFALEGMSAFQELEGKKFSQLGKFKAELEATTIRCIVLRKENDESLIREIFSRLNQGAVKLSDQEIRHALYPGNFDKLICKLAKIPQIKSFGKGAASKVEENSREAEERVLRFFALSEGLAAYGDRLSKFLDEYMASQALIDEKACLVLERNFKQALNNCIEVFGEKQLFMDKSNVRARQSMVYYDLLMPTLFKVPTEKIKTNKKRINDAFDILCASAEFKKTLSGGLQNKSSIASRRTIWQNLLRKHII